MLRGGASRARSHRRGLAPGGNHYILVVRLSTTGLHWASRFPFASTRTCATNSKRRRGRVGSASRPCSVSSRRKQPPRHAKRVSGGQVQRLVPVSQLRRRLGPSTRNGGRPTPMPAETTTALVLRAGQIVLADWRGDALPKEPNKRRPAVVVEDDRLFAPSYPNVLLVPLTADATLAIPDLSVALVPTASMLGSVASRGDHLQSAPSPHAVPHNVGSARCHSPANRTCRGYRGVTGVGDSREVSSGILAGQLAANGFPAPAADAAHGTDAIPSRLVPAGEFWCLGVYPPIWSRCRTPPAGTSSCRAGRMTPCADSWLPRDAAGRASCRALSKRPFKPASSNWRPNMRSGKTPAFPGRRSRMPLMRLWSGHDTSDAHRARQQHLSKRPPFPARAIAETW